MCKVWYFGLKHWYATYMRARIYDVYLLEFLSWLRARSAHAARAKFEFHYQITQSPQEKRNCYLYINQILNVRTKVMLIIYVRKFS